MVYLLIGWPNELRCLIQSTRTVSWVGDVSCCLPWACLWDWQRSIIRNVKTIVLGGRSLDSLMAKAQTRQETRQLCVAMLLNKQPKEVLRTPELLLGPQTLHHLTWIWAKLTIIPWAAESCFMTAVTLGFSWPERMLQPSWRMPSPQVWCHSCALWLTGAFKGHRHWMKHETRRGLFNDTLGGV